MSQTISAAQGYGQSIDKRNPQDHALIGKALSIPVSVAVPAISIAPLILPAPTREVDLQLRVTAPVSGQNLPIILLSHGQGGSNHLSSLNGYGPMVQFWASHGFVVIQPTHQSSRSLDLKPKTPGAVLFWKSRAEDMSFIINHLDDIEEIAPFLKGRLDRSRIAIAGHSMGGHTASLLLGARTTDQDTGLAVDLTEPRIKAGVLLAAPGSGGESLSKFAAENYVFFKHISFAEMSTPALVVVGDADDSAHLNVRGPQWHEDPYHMSSGPKDLLTLYGAGHGLGGIAGYDAKETDDESVERVGAVQRLTWAYLRSALYPEDNAWSEACAALEQLVEIGKTERRTS